MKQIIIQPTIDKLIKDNNMGKLEQMTAGNWTKKQTKGKAATYYVKTDIN